MKKILIILTTVFLNSAAFAQESIVYTDLDPDIKVTYYRTTTGNGPDVLIDIDQDGNNDFRFYPYNEWGLMISLWLKREQGEWQFRVPYQLYDEYHSPPIVGDTIHLGDTISNIEDCWFNFYCFFYNVNWHDNPEQSLFVGPNDHCYLSVRKAVEDGYCYGWIDAIIYIPSNNQVDDYPIYLTVCSMAYCTIPNYPLMVGQTDFTWDVDETGAVGFAVVQPNPTDGQVTVWGKDLSRAEVFNALGQHVASASGQGERLVIRLDGQPAGIYFIEVTDTQGRRCVKKVVK